MAAKKKMPAIDVPQTYDAADAILKAYGEAQIALAHLQADMTAAVAKATAEFEAAATPHKLALTTMEAQLAAFAAAHRDKLTDNNKTKTVKMPAGEIGWRNDPPSVCWKSGFKVATILGVIAQEIETLKWSKKPGDVERVTQLRTFIRIKSEPNKEAMLANPDLAKQIEGVRIVTGAEQFFIAPVSAELAEPKP